jgi:hypothetical protein
MNTCAHCSKPLDGKRSHARTCSPRCRKALSRHESVTPAELFMPIVRCAVCNGKEHDRCRFTSGSLFCVAANCRNPHHLRKAS